MYLVEAQVGVCKRRNVGQFIIAASSYTYNGWWWNRIFDGLRLRRLVGWPYGEGLSLME